jgi:hypothetical protein
MLGASSVSAGSTSSAQPPLATSQASQASGMTLAGVLIGGAKPWYQLQRERTLPASPLSGLAWSVARPISAAEASSPQDRIAPGGVRPIIAKKSHHTFAAKRKCDKGPSKSSV